MRVMQNRRSLISLNHQYGIGIVEVMVTIVITTIGLLGLSALQLQASKATQDSGGRSQALWIVDDLVNRIRANEAAAANYNTNGKYTCSTPTKMCSAYHDGSSRVAAVACTNSEMATFDLWELACANRASVSGSDFTKSNAADFIPNPELNVAHDASTNRVTISLTWDVRTQGVNSDGDTIYVDTASTGKSVNSSVTRTATHEVEFQL